MKVKASTSQCSRLVMLV